MRCRLVGGFSFPSAAASPGDRLVDRGAEGPDERRARSGTRSRARGLAAEQAACQALLSDGWTILAQRLRTPAGELDIIAEKAGLLAILEVKARPSLAEAAYAVSERQRRRLLQAASAVLAAHPDWGRAGIRFDVILVDAALRVRRIIDAFRLEE